MGNLQEGKTVLVTGVANKWSIAYGIAEAMHREGASLILTYQSERQLKMVEDIAASFSNAPLWKCDVSQDEDLEALSEKLKADGRKISTLVHSIAFANRDDLTNPFLETSREGFSLAHDVSAYSLVALSRAVAPYLEEGGSVLTLTYIGSVRAVQNYNVMGVAKASLEATMRYLANELGPQGIRVNAISAGPIKTAAARAVGDFSKILGHVEQRAPLRRNTNIAEVGDTAVFLASHLARGVTGNTVYVDSGYQIIGF
jgi:enoyl-[acyl-carrier protein] reductase I